MKYSLREKVVIAAVFAVFFCVYLANIAPAINSDDSPETVIACHTLGVQHPPGYPLIAMLGKVFIQLPAGSVMFRVNLMSAFFNVLAGLLLFFMVSGFFSGRKTYERMFIGFTAAAIYMFSATAWLQASTAKGGIYTLNSLLTLICFWAIFNIKKSIRYFYLFGFIWGVSMGNHWTSTAAIAPAFLLYLFFRRRLITPGQAGIAAVFFLAGASVYLFAVIRTLGGAAYGWGEIRSVQDLFWLITRAQYAGIEVKHTLGDTLNLLSYHIRNFFLKETPLLAGLLFIPGVWRALKTRRDEAAALLAAYVMIVLSLSLIHISEPTRPY